MTFAIFAIWIWKFIFFFKKSPRCHSESDDTSNIIFRDCWKSWPRRHLLTRLICLLAIIWYKIYLITTERNPMKTLYNYVNTSVCPCWKLNGNQQEHPDLIFEIANYSINWAIKHHNKFIIIAKDISCYPRLRPSGLKKL